MRKLKNADINLLRVFAAVAECGGISAAQNRLDVSSSTISTQIQQLEDKLGFVLCQRGRKGFSLTDKGRATLLVLNKLSAQIDTFQQEVSKIKANESGIIKIGLLDSMSRNPASNLTGALNEFMLKSPEFTVELLNFNPSDIDDALLTNKIDLAIAWTPTQLASLNYHCIFKEQLSIYCAKGHPLYKLEDNKIKSEELSKLNWASRLYDLPTGIPHAIPPISTASANNEEGTVQLVLTGLFIAYLPDDLAKKWVDEGLLKQILKDKLSYKVDFNLIRRKNAVTRHLSDTFCNILIKHHS